MSGYGSSTSFGNSRSRPTEVVVEGSDFVDYLRERLVSLSSRLEPGQDLSALVSMAEKLIGEATHEILEATTNLDAFDVLELMRQRELGLPALGHNGEGSAATIELVGVVLLARGSRTPKPEPTGDRANQVVETVRDAANFILTLASFSRLDEADEDGGGLTELLARYVMHEVHVRNIQYQRIQDEINAALFGAETFGDGDPKFTYSDFVAVREAIGEKYTDRYYRSLQDFAGAFRSGRPNLRGKKGVRDRTLGKKAVSDLFIAPGNRASFSAADIQEVCSIDEETISAVLEFFSVEFFEGSSLGVVQEFLKARNPFSSTPLLKDSAGNFLQVSGEIGADKFRHNYEMSELSPEAKKSYISRRSQVAESIAVQYLQKVLGSAVSHSTFKYFAPKEDVSIGLLGKDASEVGKLAKQCESDGLFILDDVAICVEVKSSSIKAAASAGDKLRLDRDLRKIIGEASEQAHRIAELILENHGLWLSTSLWLDLSNVREVHSIVVTLDDTAPISTDLVNLVRAGIVSDERIPWIVSIHDLMTIATVLDRPAEFLLYLRRRTEPETSKRFLSLDELDLFVLFLDGGLYAEPDPDWVRSRYPYAPVKSRVREKQAESRVARTLVSNLSDGLSEWMNLGHLDSSIPKPSFKSHPGVLALVDFLSEGRKLGWFRFGADLLHLNMETQELIVKGLQEISKKTAHDGEHHSLAVSFEGAWGFPSFVGYTHPEGVDLEVSVNRFMLYMTVKKHQLISDRTLGLLLDKDGRLVSGNYLNDSPRPDEELDKLAKEMGLASSKPFAGTPPPYARRKQKRLRGKRKPR